jgi:hypothetical protein
MRRVTLFLAAALLLIGAAPAGAVTTTKTGPFPAFQDLRIAGCPFPVLLTDRGGRTLTTTYEDDRVVRHVVTGSSAVELKNGETGRTLTFTIKERAVYVVNDDGSVTLTQRGSSGLLVDPGTVTGSPSLTWYGGTAATTGTLADDGTFRFDEVTTQSLNGFGGDVCEMLVSGLKTRH